MPTISDRQRTCSYCGGAPFPTAEAFGEHWKQCPVRIRHGYIPKPKDQASPEAARLREEAAKLLAEAEKLERIAGQ